MSQFTVHGASSMMERDARTYTLEQPNAMIDAKPSGSPQKDEATSEPTPVLADRGQRIIPLARIETTP
jgi:hypothetical protein